MVYSGVVAATATIKVDPILKDRIRAHAEHPRETIGDIIRRALDALEATAEEP